MHTNEHNKEVDSQQQFDVNNDVPTGNKQQQLTPQQQTEAVGNNVSVAMEEQTIDMDESNFSGFDIIFKRFTTETGP